MNRAAGSKGSKMITPIAHPNDRPLRILQVLGQRPAMTGSGVVVRQLYTSGRDAGDLQRVLCAGYPDDNWKHIFGLDYKMITCSLSERHGILPFAIPGMSDIMPYPSAQYKTLSPEQVEVYVQTFRRSLLEYLNAFHPDILHVHHLWVLAALTRLSAIPSCITVHGTDLQQARLAPAHRHWVDESISYVGRCLCVSTDILADVGMLYPALSNRLSIIGNGFDAEIFGVAGPRVTHLRNIVLCAGKLVDWKGFRYAVRASAQVELPHTLIIAGGGPDRERVALENEAARLGVNMLLVGHITSEELAMWMRAAHVFLMPSIKEAFGIALLEALACGCRAVAAATGGPRDIVVSQLISAGFATLVNPLAEGNDEDESRYVTDLAAALRVQLERVSDVASRTTIAEAVRDRTWGQVYQKLREVYVGLLE